MNGKKKGFTLVELMIVVVILGILAAIAIPLYMKFVQSSKAGEARLNLGKIASLLERYYDARGNQSTDLTVTVGTSSTMVPSFPINDAGGCVAQGAAQQRVPTAIASVQNMKYTPSEEDWMGTTALPSAWSMIPFAITQPIAYQYCYHGAGTSNNSIFTTGAFGDLDADGAWSSFRRAGKILCTSGTSCAVSVGAIVVTNESE
jgi:prepilin-type N-terminal cleavage/methylation domain-containing protein